MQYLRLVGAGPSLNTWPRCASHLAQSTSVRSMNKLMSFSTLTFSCAAGFQKLGQPVPESNFSAERNKAVPQHTHRYSPVSWLFQYRPVKARSVPLRRATAYSSADNSRFHSSSVFITLFTVITPFLSPRSEKTTRCTSAPDPFWRASGNGRSFRDDTATRPAKANGTIR